MIEKMAALISPAFGLVAALAQNDLIKTIFAETFGTTAAIGTLVIYAVIVTIIAVIFTVTVANAVSKVKSVFRQEMFSVNCVPSKQKWNQNSWNTK